MVKFIPQFRDLIMPLALPKFAWKNGRIIPWREATVHISCHGLHYGTGVIETIRCYETPSGPAVFRLGTHVDRWFLSAQICGISWPYKRQDVANAVIELVRANDLCDCHIRLIAFHGAHSLDIQPKGPLEVAMLVWPSEARTEPYGSATGVDVCISPWRKISPHAIPARAKSCGRYLNSVLAFREAAGRGFSEAILLDDAGNLTEGVGGNLFLVHNNRLLTNDQESSAFLGVTRDTVIRIASDLGIAVFVRKLPVSILLEADEAFLTGTAAEITPIRTVDMNPIGSGVCGPVTARLQDAYQKAVTGRTARYQEWLTYVSPRR